MASTLKHKKPRTTQAKVADMTTDELQTMMETLIDRKMSELQFHALDILPTLRLSSLSCSTYLFTLRVFYDRYTDRLLNGSHLSGMTVALRVASDVSVVRRRNRGSQRC
jgi:hypothetical protein